MAVPLFRVKQMNDFAEPSQLGQLLIVATPIGNLGDITQRAIEALSSSDYLAVEDSRHSRKLLSFLGLNTPMLSLHEHNERQRADQIINDCLAGKTVALISDAGTPLISDPGYFLVREALKKGVRVSPIPGACAAIAALSCSGIASNSFIFEGFLPARKNQREAQLKLLSRETRTLIFYESTHRIQEFVESLIQEFGPTREITLGKELTKSFEAVWHGEVQDLISWFKDKPERCKGEFVIVVEGSKQTEEASTLMDDESLMKRLLKDLSVKQASLLAADLTGKRKKHFYQMGLSLEHAAE